MIDDPGMPKNAVTGDEYSGRNPLLLLAAEETYNRTQPLTAADDYCECCGEPEKFCECLGPRDTLELIERWITGGRVMLAFMLAALIVLAITNTGR